MNGIGTSCPPGLKTYVPCPTPVNITLTNVPIDWNRNGIIDNAPVNQDINCNLDLDPNSAPIHKLRGHDDWKSIGISYTPLPDHLLINLVFQILRL